MIFDAVCACSTIYHHERRTHPVQNEVLEILKARTGETFKEGAPSFSTMCGIVAAYLPSPSTATLDDLYAMFAAFPDVDSVVREKMKNEFTQAYVFPVLNMMKKGGAEIFCRYITALKEADFEELWRTKILPVEEEQIRKLESAIPSADLDRILNMVAGLKGVPCPTVTTYISLLSYPISFSLDETAFLDTVNTRKSYAPNGFLSMIAHELMHGFSSTALTEAYLAFMKSSCYLRSTHRALLHDMHAGNEEEFVMAAESYILWRSGIMTKEQIVLQNYSRYGGCVPLALYIFAHMTRENAPITDYRSWLLAQFESGAFSPDDVISTIDSLLPPPNNYDNFFANLFVILQRCSYIIRDAQIEHSGDIKTEIERLTNAGFTPKAEKTVSFAEGSRLLNGEKRETLQSGRLTIDRIEFASKKEALSLWFPYSGANVGVSAVNYAGERFTNAYCLNLAYHKDKANRAEFSFVCGNVKYLITSACPDGVIDLDCAEDRDLGYRTYGREMIDAIKAAESIVMLLG